MCVCVCKRERCGDTWIEKSVLGGSARKYVVCMYNEVRSKEQMDICHWKKYASS